MPLLKNRPPVLEVPEGRDLRGMDIGPGPLGLIEAVADFVAVRCVREKAVGFAVQLVIHGNDADVILLIGRGGQVGGRVRIK